MKNRLPEIELEENIVPEIVVLPDLDQIAQEAAREATTLSTKLSHARLARYTLELRHAIGAIREHAHNVA